MTLEFVQVDLNKETFNCSCVVIQFLLPLCNLAHVSVIYSVDMFYRCLMQVYQMIALYNNTSNLHVAHPGNRRVSLWPNIDNSGEAIILFIVEPS